ncbi:hypothetical protein [Alteribacillus bidgolensis]|uniref:Uncharacterized protein n=1 Tax=Alteribacillus bidgolensis TaxID=930129 RepID=A0A1G8CHD2_9BACI|nr:hypothetical protein [Alteribacillus bidgolensis]SDH44330.1 hypothetical protein SAMN05216352_101307 [Alteribacillus bidgolensis]
MTEEKAYKILQRVYTDELMQQEKRRVLRLLYRHIKEQLNVLGIRDQLESANNKLERFKEFTYIPGDNILKSMQYVFNAARGERNTNKDEARLHLQRIYKTLYQPAGRKRPVIPEHFWSTPLGAACLVTEGGVETIFDLLKEVEETERE